MKRERRRRAPRRRDLLVVLGDDLKGGRAKGEGLGVRLVRPALTVADSDLDLVLARLRAIANTRG